MVAHFAKDGLTTADYLHAAKRQTRILTQRPLTLIGNIEGVSNHFAVDGLTLREYLQAALKQPALFCQKSKTLIANIEGVVDHFAVDGLTKRAYLQAAVQRPNLFYQKPQTLIANIEGIVKHFATEGLNTQAYLQAAIKQPHLFTQKPATMIGNIEGVVKHFAAEGLTVGDYLLAAALRQPALFTQKPSTIAGHINLIESLQEQGLLAIDRGKPALFAFVLEHPMYLALADHNFHLREITAHSNDSTASLRVPRRDVESLLAKLLGHSDMKTPVPKIERPQTPGADLGPHAKNLLLRALIREGYLKGKPR